MLEILGFIIGLLLFLFLLVYPLQLMAKEKKELSKYRQDILNAISQISLSIEDTFKER